MMQLESQTMDQEHQCITHLLCQSQQELFLIENNQPNIQFVSKVSKDQSHVEIDKISEYNLDDHKRRSIKIIDKINKNIAKLHKFSNINWSIKDASAKLFSRKINNSQETLSRSVYKVKPESIFRYGKSKYEDFITGAGYLNDPSDLEVKIQNDYFKKNNRLYDPDAVRANNKSVQPSDSFSIQSITEEIKQANEDQKLQYYLNIAKGIVLVLMHSCEKA